MDKYGINGQVLHVDLANGAFKTETMDESWYRAYASGAMMGSYFMLRDTAPGIDALGADNLLIFSVGVAAGFNASALAQFSVTSRSPMTGSIAHTQCEGAFGGYLKASGYDAVIFHGKSQKSVSLFIDDGKPSLVDARWVYGKNAIETATLYARAYGLDPEAIMSIGQAGENMVRFASIVSGVGNQARRCGIGAVMGGKNLKSLMLRGGALPKVFDPILMEKFSPIAFHASNRASFSIKDAPFFEYSDYGRNLSPTDRADDGDTTDALSRISSHYRGECRCPCCSCDCIKYIGVKEAPLSATSLNPWVIGNFFGDANPDLTLLINTLCNCYGLDCVELRQTIRFARECAQNGIISGELDGFELADDSSLLPLIASVTERKGIGDILAQGVKRAADLLGDEALPYTNHYAVRRKNTPIAAKSAKLRRQSVAAYSVHKILSLCRFAPEPQTEKALVEFCELIRAITGWNVSLSDFERWNDRRHRLVWFYGVRDAGIVFDDPNARFEAL